MLWSLLKILIFVALVAALALGAIALMDAETALRIVVANKEYVLDPLQAVIASLVLVLLVWLLIKIAGFAIATVKFLIGDETAISRYFDRNRERKGFNALSEGILALASGEGRVAMSKAARAEKFLNRPDLTNLITAQAAEMSGDTKKAQEVYKRLLSDERTRFVGIRGIMKQRLAEGDTATALKLAEKAFSIRPKNEETQDILLKLQAGSADWAGARRTLGTKFKQGKLPRDVHKRRDAVLALSEAKDILDVGQSIEAQEAAIMANRMSPDLIPAAVMAARTYIEQGKGKYAARVLKKAWESQPHPDLASAFADIAPGESPQDRLSRFRALTRSRPDDPETKMLLAELNIAAEDFPAARKALGDLASNDPTARSLTLMAAIERGEGSSDAIVRGWLTKALSASRGPQWVCDKCQKVHTNWGPVCDNCGGFDTLSWKVPTTGEVAMPSSTELLPLLVGASEETPDDTPFDMSDIIDAETLEEDEKAEK